MVLKRQCSFCADEVEPGTGTMYVKRDGTIFWFCTSSCRKQQLHLGRTVRTAGDVLGHPRAIRTGQPAGRVRRQCIPQVPVLAFTHRRAP